MKERFYFNLSSVSYLGKVQHSGSWWCHKFNIFKFTAGSRLKEKENLLWMCSKIVISTSKTWKVTCGLLSYPISVSKSRTDFGFWIKSHWHFTFFTFEVCGSGMLVVPRRESLSYTSVLKNKQRFPTGWSSKESHSIENIYFDF